jgi:hypothetical protein
MVRLDTAEKIWGDRWPREFEISNRYTGGSRRPRAPNWATNTFRASKPHSQQQQPTEQHHTAAKIKPRGISQAQSEASSRLRPLSDSQARRGRWRERMEAAALSSRMALSANRFANHRAVGGTPALLFFCWMFFNFGVILGASLVTLCG